jgi:hypothetical protein
MPTFPACLVSFQKPRATAGAQLHFRRSRHDDYHSYSSQLVGADVSKLSSLAQSYLRPMAAMTIDKSVSSIISSIEFPLRRSN